MNIAFHLQKYGCIYNGICEMGIISCVGMIFKVNILYGHMILPISYYFFIKYYLHFMWSCNIQKCVFQIRENEKIFGTSEFEFSK